MPLDVDRAAAKQRRWLRHTVHGLDPSARRSPPSDHRWQRGAIVDALYLADSELTAWAEWYRHLAEGGVPPDQQMPRDLWSWEVSRTLRIADLTTPERLGRVGLSVPRPSRRTWPSCQEVGETLWREGWRGLLAPSAARPEGLVLCLFRDHERIRGARPVPPPRVFEQAPAPPTGMTT